MNILSIVQGFKIPFSQTISPFQYDPPQFTKVNQEERLQINSEINRVWINDRDLGKYNPFLVFHDAVFPT